MNIYIPISLLITSIILLIITTFLLFYFGENSASIAFFSIGIVLGLIACAIFIYLRTPQVIYEIDYIYTN